jgi:DNA primase
MITHDGAERTGEPYGVRRAIKFLKEYVDIQEYARTVTALRPAGNTLRGPCPVHEGDNPDAFAVYPAEGRFYCFNCNEGGDVVDLARAVEGGDVWTAMVSLAERFGVDLPLRPERWHKAQDDKARIREAAKKQIAAVYQRRLTRLYAPLMLLGGETPEEELAALEELAKSLWPICLSMASGRVNRA